MVAKKTTSVIQRCINRSTVFELRQEIAPLLALLVRPHLECCVGLGSTVSEGQPRPGGHLMEGKLSGKRAL